ncbi:MAG: ATP-binding protein [Bacillus sp. (in: firmicutes)]
MKLFRTNIYLYVVIIIIPTILATFMYRQYLEHQGWDRIQNETQELGRWQQQYIETLIKETVKSLDILSILPVDIMEQQDEITQLLIKTKKSDKRFSELYLVDKNGVVQTGTTDIYNNIKIRSSYMDSCVKFKKAVVAFKKNEKFKKEDFIYVCKPIMPDKQTIDGFLFAEIQVDYIKNLLELLTPNATSILIDEKNQVIFTLNEHLQHGELEYAIPFEDLPWTIHIDNTNQDININSVALLKFVILFLIITHLIFLAVQYILLKRDANRRRKIHENQKLKMLGTLAATTAHEIKNPLTGIKGLVQLLNEKYKDTQDQMYFSVIQTEITRINEIVNQFLVLGKPSVQENQLVDLNEVMKELQPLLESEASDRQLTVHFVYNTGPLLVLCAKDQIKQVILNIVKNSFDASPKGTEILVSLYQEYKKAIIFVQDNGTGMSKETLQQIFEPFFTTKSTGTGLGLYVCKRILTLYEGELSICSELNKGTDVEIILPVRSISE